MRLEPSLVSWAGRHHGLLTLDRWTSARLSRLSWYRAIDTGLLVPLRTGVARLPGAPVTPALRIAAAQMSVGGGALASHRSAAWLWDAAPVGDDPIDLIVTSRSRRPRAEGIVVHRPTDLVDLRPTIRSAISTCNPLRCLVDLGAVDEGLVGSALESMLISGLVSVRAVSSALLRHRGHGRHGVTALAQAIDGLALGECAPDSSLETKLAEVLDAYAIWGWQAHYVIAGHEVDFAFPDVRLVIEADGWGSHGTRAQFEQDRRRDSEVVAAGWVVLRFTWLQVTRRPAWVAKQIRATIESRTDQLRRAGRRLPISGPRESDVDTSSPQIDGRRGAARPARARGASGR